MKLSILIVTVFVIQCAYCQDSRPRRSAYEYISNKTYAVVDYVKGKAKSVWPFGKISDTVTDSANKLKLKLKYYIDEAQRTTSTIFDRIAPKLSDNDFECSDTDPAIHMNTPQLITLNGYFSESHVVLTEDGYMLTVYRIPYSRNSSGEISKKAVLIHHGVLGSSDDFVLTGPRNSLAFILSDAGYDVWLANARGNVYSRAHISRTSDSEAFWDFSFHEIGQLDLPAVIDYIIKRKGNDAKINYVGLSMGTTVLFNLLATKIEYNIKLNSAVALAPIAYMSQVKSPFKLLSKYGNSIARFLKLVDAKEFLPRNAAVRYLSKHSCSVAHFEEALCELTMFVICGHDNEHFDRSLIPMVLGHIPAGASTKTLVHYAQEINNGGRFQQFDYGSKENLERYGVEIPPAYKIQNITLPISLISGEDDWLSSLPDARRLFSELKNPVEHYLVKDKTFNHIDFVLAKDVRSLVYDKLLEILEKSSFH